VFLQLPKQFNLKVLGEFLKYTNLCLMTSNDHYKFSLVIILKENAWVGFTLLEPKICHQYPAVLLKKCNAMSTSHTCCSEGELHMLAVLPW